MYTISIELSEKLRGGDVLITFVTLSPFGDSHMYLTKEEAKELLEKLEKWNDTRTD